MAAPVFAPYRACLNGTRRLVRVVGPDAFKLVQAQTSQEMRLLDAGTHKASPLIFTGFFSEKGRLLLDAIVGRDAPQSYLFDTSVARGDALLAHLKKFKLRSKVTIEDVTAAYNVFHVLPGAGSVAEAAVVSGTDPRVAALGTRLYTASSGAPQPAAHAAEYNEHRISQGVPEGAEFGELPVPLEMNLDWLHGVSFSKGCYIGQELTGRTHFKGVIRKRMMPLRIGASAEAVCTGEGGGARPTNTVTTNAGEELFGPTGDKPAATIHASAGDYALAVVREEMWSGDTVLTTRRATGPQIFARPYRPAWWPQPAVKL